MSETEDVRVKPGVYRMRDGGTTEVWGRHGKEGNPLYPNYGLISSAKDCDGWDDAGRSWNSTDFDLVERIGPLPPAENAALEPAPKPAGGEWVTDDLVERVAIERHHRYDDEDTVKWGKQPSRYRTSARKTAREVLTSLAAVRPATPPAPAASLSGGEVTVKALGWRRGYCDDQVIIEQASFGGLYQVRQFDGDIWLDHPSASSSKHETVGAAKAAAQADFEQRILSNLTSPKAPQASEVVRDLARQAGDLATTAIRRMRAAHVDCRDLTMDCEQLLCALAKIGGDHE